MGNNTRKHSMMESNRMSWDADFPPYLSGFAEFYVSLQRKNDWQGISRLLESHPEVTLRVDKYAIMREVFGYSQSTLKYLYESAIGRMEYHTDYAEKYKRVIQEYPFYKSKKEVAKAAIELKRRNPIHCQVWAKIGRDEEYFYIEDYFIVSDDIKVLIAAEYIGMAQISLKHIIDDWND